MTIRMMGKVPTDHSHGHLNITQRMGMENTANMGGVGKSTTLTGDQSHQITRKTMMMRCGDCTLCLASLVSLYVRAYMMELWVLFISGSD
jgi:hypothetical protein